MEERVGKLESTQQLQRIAAMPYNPKLRKDADGIRERYGILVDESTESFSDQPLDRLAMILRNHPGEQLPSQRFLIRDPSGPARGYEEHSEADWPHGLSWYLDEIRAYRFSALPSSYAWPDDSTHSSSELMEEDPFHKVPETEIPFERDVLNLMARYGIPFRFFANIVLYVVTRAETALLACDYSPSVTIEDIYKRGDLEHKITVMGIDRFITKREWERLWVGVVKPHLRLFEGLPDWQVSTKRKTVESYRKHIKRSSEWYQLIETQGLSIKEALDNWALDNPEQAETENPDGSTLSKAVEEFRKIINPMG